MRRVCVVLALWASCGSGATVKVTKGSIEMPAYEHLGRETQPPLFAGSTVGGMYPLPPFILPLKSVPKRRTYEAVFVENEYLKLTYLPEFGGRFFSLFDKIRKREVFYRNDAIKPANYNSKGSFPLFGIELTGAFDTHMLTLYGEPFWSHRVVRHADGSVSLVLGTIDPVYRMKVNFAARVYPALAAVQLSVFCYNTRDGRRPHMFWISGSLRATEKTRFAYPMTRTIGHTTSEVGDWPVFNGIDYSWDRNNKNMLGVFGIDIYDDFQGAYHEDLDYGVFRYADRRVVQGMKMWTFGYSDRATYLERAYTDNAGPYIEVQSGRYVWDGYYEWLAPHKVENWSEWWFPVAGIGGLTTTSRDVALNLEVQPGTAGRNSVVTVGLSANRPLPGARITVEAKRGEILSAITDLAPEKPFRRKVDSIAAGEEGLRGIVVKVTDSAGTEILLYRRPDESPGRKEYTPFTRPLERPAKEPQEMSIEELALAAEVKYKQLNAAGAADLLNRALEKDPGYSRAHLMFGIHHFNSGRPREAVEHLEKAIDRDPYLFEAHYYLAMSRLVLGQERAGERSLYFIPPDSVYFANREYHLGRLALERSERDKAVEHLERAVKSNGYYLDALLLLALIDREQGSRAHALARLAEVEAIDPTNQWAAAERFFLARGAETRKALWELMGGQSQEALEISQFYRSLGRWKEAVEVLRLVEHENRDPWGTPSEFHYTLAYCLKRSGAEAESVEYLKKARAAAGNIDRFPYRDESEPVLREAVERDPNDAVARFYLACLLYHQGRPDEAIRQWEAAAGTSPSDFRTRRALGLAYEEQGRGVEKAAEQLEKAIAIDPGHVRTLNDLSTIYAKTGRFDEQTALLERALSRSPEDDDLAEGLLLANLARGRYAEAEKLATGRKFGPRHRTYGLRDKWRFLKYGMGAAAFREGSYGEALRQFEAALAPPVSLGVDDFGSQSTPRAHYYIGRTLEALGRQGEARAAYEKAAAGYEHLSGDWDSWNAENVHMALALDRLGKTTEASRILGELEGFARSQLDSGRVMRRAGSRYLLALLLKHKGEHAEARRLLDEALEIQPDLLGARLELRGDVVDRLGR
jgi:tetratricopeptide (TPR) repeat protein